MCERRRIEAASQEGNTSHVTRVISKNNIPLRSQFSRASKEKEEKCKRERKRVTSVFNVLAVVKGSRWKRALGDTEGGLLIRLENEEYTQQEEYNAEKCMLGVTESSAIYTALFASYVCSGPFLARL